MRHRMIRMWLWLMCVMIMSLRPGAVLGEESSPAPIGMLKVDGYEITFADVMAEEINWIHDSTTAEADLCFYLQLSRKQNVPVFTMTMMQDQADYVGILTGPEEEFVPVGFMLAEPPPSLSGEQLLQFRVAQQEVYVLLATMELTAVPEVEAEVVQEPLGLIAMEVGELSLICSEMWANQLEYYVQDETIVFQAIIGGEAYPAFTLQVGAEKGDIMIFLKDDDGERVSVASWLAPVPETLSTEDERTFHILQDVLGELLDSAALR